VGSLSFEKAKRLLTPAHFERVFSDAIPAVSPQITALARHNTLTHARLGITISKKRVKLAKDRNRLKRVVREYFRHHCTDLPNIDIIIVAKSGIADLSNKEIYECMDNLWRKLKKRCATRS
jgi:ribonuclease P protein component